MLKPDFFYFHLPTRKFYRIKLKGKISNFTSSSPIPMMLWFRSVQYVNFQCIVTEPSSIFTEIGIYTKIYDPFQSKGLLFSYLNTRHLLFELLDFEKAFQNVKNYFDPVKEQKKILHIL